MEESGGGKEREWGQIVILDSWLKLAGGNHQIIVEDSSPPHPRPVSFKSICISSDEQMSLTSAACPSRSRCQETREKIHNCKL